ncbi:MAG: hypothetical protein ACSHXL_03620 [Bacteroidota bacterium]
MKFPNSGRVVVVDDKFAEAQPIMSSLAKDGLASCYYDSSEEQLPNKPLKGVRVLFLDLDLKGGTGSANIKTMASSAAKVLTTIIDKDNGPFIIIFWSKHSKDDDVMGKVLGYAEKRGVVPSMHIDLEKSACITGDNEFDLSVVKRKLIKALENMRALTLYTEWEGIVHSSATKFVHDISKLTPMNNWDTYTIEMFNQLWEVHSKRKNTEASDSDKFRSAVDVLNTSFYDTLQSTARKSMRLPKFMEMAKVQKFNDFEMIAKLNTSLFIDDVLHEIVDVGAVYRCKDINLRKAIEASVFANKSEVNAPKSSFLCRLVITPSCDLANDKTLKIKTNKSKHHIHRVVYGIMYKPEESESGGSIPAAIIKTGTIWYRQASWKLVFHAGSLGYVSEGEFIKNPIFKIKKELVFDIQAKLSSHVNRPGNYML